MPFDDGLSFVNDVQEFVAKGQVDRCISYLESYLRKQPPSPMHWLVGKDFKQLFPSYSSWLLKCAQDISDPGPTTVISTPIGELDSNYDHWGAQAIWYPDYNGEDDPYTWLGESFSSCRFLGDDYRFRDLDELSKAYEYAEAEEPSPVSDETFTAVSYLFFLRFVELNRDTHRLAGANANPLAQCHLMSVYSNKVYHSRPKHGRSAHE
jgi:hypothetical protein